jgi:hypothetical protein
MNNFNTWLWDIVNTAGWWWWGPCVVIAVKNMVILSGLNAPVTGLGRTARVFAWMAHIPMLFSLQFNAMGCIALPLMLVANNVLYIQLWLACRRERRQASPNPHYGVQRVLSKMIQ